MMKSGLDSLGKSNLLSLEIDHRSSIVSNKAYDRWVSSTAFCAVSEREGKHHR